MRKTIGFLIDFFCETYQVEILSGVAAEARAQDLNLLCFIGGELNSPQQHHELRNDIYNLVDRDSIDGLIVLGGSIGNFASPGQLCAFFNKFIPLPVVNIGSDINLGDIPNILIDNASGMRDAVEHIICEHECSRLAFIKGTEGNQEAQLRFDAYKEVLEKHNIPFDPDLIAPGNFYTGSGRRAVSLLLDERKVTFDAVIGCNDIMAIEALKTLQEKQIRVPYDVIVVGFDNIEESRFNKPPLTTVSQPFCRMGKLAVGTLLKKIRGQATDKNIYLNAQLEVRRSCGCSLYRKRRYISLCAEKDREENGDRLSRILKNSRIHGQLVSHLSEAIMYLHPESACRLWAKELVGALTYDVNSPGEYHFLSTFDRIISEGNSLEIEFIAWDYIISTLVNNLIPFITYRTDIEYLNNLANNTVDVIRENERVRQYSFIQRSSEKSRKLHVISIELINTFSIKRLRKVIVRELPGLGMKRCYIAEYVKDQAAGKKARILVAYDEKGEINQQPGQDEYPAVKLLPESMRNGVKRDCFIIMALYFKDETLGFALFDFTPLEGIIYERLVIQISGTLKGAKLIEKVQQHTEELQNKNIALEKQQVKLSHHVKQLGEAMTGFINTLITTVEVRDPYTAGHLRRVSDLACAIAREMGLPEEKIQNIQMAASIHDLGKIYVPSEILNRPGVLTDLEMVMIKTHPQVAYNILKNIDFPWPIAEIIYQHHEYYDGSGYPRGLQGENILLEARIICVADVVEAIASHRPYRSALGIEAALEEIKKNAGKMFDTEVVATCVMLITEKGYKLI